MTIYLTKKMLKEIDDKVLEWHDSTEDGILLSSYLGMSKAEYKDFVEFNIVDISKDSLILNNNGKGWNITVNGMSWISYDKHSNRFHPGWCSYYETKEEAEEVKVKLFNE